MMFLKSYLRDVIVTATHLIHWLPSRSFYYASLVTRCSAKCLIHIINLTPKNIGCNCFVHVHQQNYDKFDLCSLKCFFIGNSTQKARKVTNSPLDVSFVPEMLPSVSERLLEMLNEENHSSMNDLDVEDAINKAQISLHIVSCAYTCLTPPYMNLLILSCVILINETSKLKPKIPEPKKHILISMNLEPSNKEMGSYARSNPIMVSSFKLIPLWKIH